MNECEIMDESLAKAFLENKDTVTIDKYVALKIVTDLKVLKQIRQNIGLLDRRDELERQ